MTAEWTATNARVVLRDSVIDGSVHVRDGRIAAVDEGPSAVAGAMDFEGDYLIPGLVEIHTDNVEKHFLPRPGVVWPSGLSAVMAHDTQIAGAGITTVFDAMSVGDYHAGGVRREIFFMAVDAIRHAQDVGMFRVEHFLHMRCEVSDPHMAEMFEPYANDPLVRLVSLMDHTPGQRQWNQIEKFREYHSEKAWSDTEVAEEVAARVNLQRQYAGPNRKLVLDLCRPRGLPLASHDDSDEAHVAEAVADGLTVSEFPTTRLAAEKAREAGLSVLMGAPNVVRGGSHSGNVSALALADLGLLDAMSSDYVPNSLLHAAFLLAGRPSITLPDAIATVTANPAAMVRLDDRGRIEVGKRADLARVRVSGDVPMVRTLWREGDRVS